MGESGRSKGRTEKAQRGIDKGEAEAIIMEFFIFYTSFFFFAIFYS